MTPEWTAEIAVGPTLARDLIEAQFPQLRGAGIEPLGEGWDHAAYLIANAYVFRFPRRTIAVELIARELALLPQLAPQLPLAIPIPIFSGTPSEMYPWPFGGYAIIKGVTACQHELDDAQRSALAPALGSFLRALHAIDPGPSRRAGLPDDTLGRLDHSKRLAIAHERLSRLHAQGLIDDPRMLLDWMAQIAPNDSDHARCIVHGDLYARHLVLDDRDRVVGIIDWGDVHYGDPALDLAIAFTMLPPSAHARFRDAYGSIDERTWALARYRAIYHSALVATYGLEIGDRQLIAAGRFALQ